MVFQSSTWRGCGDGATSAFPMPFATRCVSSARSRRGISRSWSVGRPGVRTWEPSGRGSRSRGSGTAGSRSWALYWRDRNFLFHVYDRVAPSSGVEELLQEIGRDPTAIFWGRPGAQGTMASVNGRSAAERMVHRSSPARRLIDDFDWCDRPRKRSWMCLGHSVPVRTGRPPASVTGSRRVARSRWRQRPGRTAPRAGHHVCCEAARSPPPGLR